MCYKATALSRQERDKYSNRRRGVIVIVPSSEEMQSACRCPSSGIHTWLTIFPGNLAVSMSGAPLLAGFTMAPLEEYFVHPGDGLGPRGRG